MRAVIGFGSSCCMVCFDGYLDTHTLDRPGFGEKFFEHEGIDAIHFVTRGNDWYQYEAIEHALGMAASAVSSYGRVLAYGSSMGGYAAIRFGGRLGVEAAVAMSPQYSIDPRVVPFESRWNADARRLDFATEARMSSGFARRSYVFYDPYDRDRHHVDLYRPHTEVIEVRLPGCGHSSTGYLAEAGLLRPCALSVIAGTLDPNDVTREARKRRRSVSLRYLALAARARQPRIRDAFLRKAREIRPPS